MTTHDVLGGPPDITGPASLTAWFESKEDYRMVDIPILTTERLTLRPMQFDDWPVYETFMQSDRARFMGGPYDFETAWGMFCAHHAQWDLFGCGALMIEDRDTGLAIGQVGINSGPLYPEQELVWFLLPEAEGRGFASEAARALRDWAKSTRKLRTLVSYIDHQNARARNVLKRLGAAVDEYAPRPDPNDLVFRHFCMRRQVVEIPRKTGQRGRPRKIVPDVRA